MKKLTLLTALLGLAACAPTNEYKDALPTQDSTRINVPASAGQALNSGTNQQALQGQTATFYTFTVDISSMINGSTVWVLDFLQNVTNNPPTSLTANGAIWGPYTDPLSANTAKLTVTKAGDGSYTYELDGKAKTAPDSSFVAILTGSANPAVDGHGQPIPGFGSGSFTINWDNAQTLPQHDNNVGTAAFQYSRTSPTAQASVKVTFTNVLDQQSGQRINANYSYIANPGNGGVFQFSEDKDFIAGPNGVEHMTVESRWMESGTGRSDVKLSGGDVPNPPGAATVSECWDTNFASQFLTASYDPTLDYGQESVCAFTPAQYSTL
jgi:hypothetical protein